MFGKKTAIAIKHDLRSGIAELSYDNKVVKTWTGKNERELNEQLPFDFVHGKVKFRLYARGEDYDVNLRIDNFDYDKLLFLSPNFNNKEVLTFKSGLMLNDVEITSQMQIEEWSQQELISIIKHKMGSKEIVKAKISGLD